MQSIDTLTDITPASLIPAAAAPIITLVHDLDPARLAARTPCASYDVRGLLNHLLFWGPVLAAAGRQESVGPPAQAESAVDLVTGDFSAAHRAMTEELVAAWRRPEAWDGETTMGAPDPIPAAVVGVMVLGELVIHGWDLGAALGRRPQWDADLLAYLLPQTAAIADMGREMGIYGPEVAVSAGGGELERLLGLTGRDPRWRP